MQYVRWSTVSFGIISILFCLLLLLNAAVGMLYDNWYFGDTLFLLGAAWRVHEGLTPAVDFGYFYGGVIEEGLSFTMTLLGHGSFVFDYFTLLMVAMLSTVAFVLLRPRISWHGYMATVLVVTTLLLTRFPLEHSQSITRMVSTHSFIYNRFALAVLIVVGLFVALPSSKVAQDGLLAILAGGLAALVCLTKPTFFIMCAGLPLALVIQGRWSASLGAGVGILSVFLTIDPMLSRFLGSFDYAMAHVGADTSISGLIRKAVQIPLSQPIALTFSFAGLAYLVHQRVAIRSVMALSIMALSGIGMATTMGGNGNLGQLALPITAMLALAAAELARRAALGGSGTLTVIASCLVLAFSGSHLLNAVQATAEAISVRDQSLITEGPFARYVSHPEQHPTDLATQYEMLADGITALKQLGDPSGWGIVADNGITFEYALMARPVPGYPLWQRASAPEFAPDSPFPQDADIVMLSRSDRANPVQSVLLAKIDGTFVRCTTSEHWEIFRRDTRELASCD